MLFSIHRLGFWSAVAEFREMISPMLRERSQLGLIYSVERFSFFPGQDLEWVTMEVCTHRFPLSYQSEPKCVVTRSDIWFRCRRGPPF